MKFLLKNAGTPLVLLARINKGRDSKVSLYTNDKGDRLVATAGLAEIFNPADGTKLKEVAGKTETLEKSASSFTVNMGNCQHCASPLVVSASIADAIEVAGEGMHCVACGKETAVSIDGSQLIAALANEMGDDDVDFSSDDDVDDGILDEDAVDSDSGVPDDSDELAEDELDDDEDSDDLDADEAEDSDELAEDDLDADDSDELAEDDLDADEAEDSDELGEDGDEDLDSDDPDLDSDLDFDVDSDDDYSDLDDEDAEDAEDDEDIEDEDDGSAEEELSSKMVTRARRLHAIATRKKARFKRRKAKASDDFDGDGDVDGDVDLDGDTSDADGSVEEEAAKILMARAKRLKSTASQKKAKSKRRKAKASDGFDDVDMSDETNFDVDADDDMNEDDEFIENSAKRRRAKAAKRRKAKASEQPEVPGTNDEDDVEAINDGDSSVNEGTPGTEVSSIQAIDWTAAEIEVIATSAGDKLILANNKPVGRLVKSKAIASVQEQWDTPVVAATFISTAKAGLRVKSAKELGLVPYKFVVSGAQVLRNNLHRATASAESKFSTQLAHAKAKHDSSFHTALLGVTRGVWKDNRNPIADALTASLTRLGIQDAKDLVETAFTKHAVTFCKTVASKTSELTAKPEAARAEIASFVATAAVQPSSSDKLINKLSTPPRVIEAAKVTNPAAEGHMARVMQALSSRNFTSKK